MLGCSNSSTVIIRGMQSSKEDANVANKSVWLFWLLGTLTTLTYWKPARKLSNIFKYCDIQWSLALKLPSVRITTSLKSENISTSFAPRFLMALSPTMRASYSTSLFEAQKLSQRDLSNLIPLGDTNTIPTPNPFALEASSMNTFHWPTLIWHTQTGPRRRVVNLAT